MRPKHFAQTARWLLQAALLVHAGCAGTPDQLFGGGGAAGAGSAGKGGGATGSGGSGGSSGGSANESGGASGGLIGAGGSNPSAGGMANGGALSQGGRASGGSVATGGSSTAAGGGLVANGGKAGGGNPPSEIIQKISRNADDCTWIAHGNDYEERLRFSDTETWIEVGNDEEQGRIGLRFMLPVPSRATIVAATLQLQRVSGSYAAADSLIVQVYDTGNVPAFDATHRHGPAGHATLFDTEIRTLAGEAGKTVTSADLKVLVQRVVDRPDFGLGDAVGTIGFVISPDMAAGWASYGDSSTGAAASLRVSYRP